MCVPLFSRSNYCTLVDNVLKSKKNAFSNNIFQACRRGRCTLPGSTAVILWKSLISSLVITWVIPTPVPAPRSIVEEDSLLAWPVASVSLAGSFGPWQIFGRPHTGTGKSLAERGRFGGQSQFYLRHRYSFQRQILPVSLPLRPGYRPPCCCRVIAGRPTPHHFCFSTFFQANLSDWLHFWCVSKEDRSRSFPDKQPQMNEW